MRIAAATAAAALLQIAGIARAEDGAALYKAKCVACHGADGKGGTPMGKALKVKSLAGTSLPAAEIEKIVAQGKPGTKMVAVKGLTPEQLSALAAHVKSLK